MKKLALVGITLLSALALGACQSGGQTQANASNITVSKGFKNDTVKRSDYTVTIDKAKVLKAHAKGNDTDHAVVALYYTLKNTGSTPTTPDAAFNDTLTVTQGKNTLDADGVPADKYLTVSGTPVKKGKSVQAASNFTLKDSKTAVKLTARNGAFGKVIGEESIDITK
ncbi:DUF5067 domain-containing protein [Schleiferilactobacillus shenzhenensis]|uniref:DUF5067 domain-containing protein n=1 Tax=Schleiferilactobacillus shenzhenensis LY-73 TaxID=1231336 RepID=U4TP28_9LACO|nr:DUF5067 domain-containing protein [Schleiferilactobacillus shenzhenensis]ERL63653.1 hypothetical protein L248_2482 [Schleiferilactobacillus shenzhenensis LY-73]